MAKKMVILLEDDLDGSEANETVNFAIDGSEYEVDLNERNAAELRLVLDPYVSAARRSSAPNRGRGRPRAAAQGSSPTSGEVREWAKAQGLSVNERGRVQATVMADYMAAH
ncbi:Lsr2 family protein [Arthrobacter sp.]|uniref:histone-like nucleoid-structuring protein Lsr2 n=1 Tax=Arthrobacter sp. TaxID=1667 RepID=UPI002810A45F|nr:Lsr2 family protein [Arthrobacter sp.]